MVDRVEEDILRALRRITRGIDLHSRQLANTFGLTAPQLVCLRSLQESGDTSPGALSRRVSLSPATVTGIVDRLAARQLVTRERKTKDRRVVTIALTEAGRALVAQAPSPLQESFLNHLQILSQAERLQIRDTLDRVVAMMGGEELQEAAALTSAPAAPSAGEGGDVLVAAEPDVTLVAQLATNFEVAGGGSHGTPEQDDS